MWYLSIRDRRRRLMRKYDDFRGGQISSRRIRWLKSLCLFLVCTIRISLCPIMSRRETMLVLYLFKSFVAVLSTGVDPRYSWIWPPSSGRIRLMIEPISCFANTSERPRWCRRFPSSCPHPRISGKSFGLRLIPQCLALCPGPGLFKGFEQLSHRGDTYKAGCQTRMSNEKPQALA